MASTLEDLIRAEILLARGGKVGLYFEDLQTGWAILINEEMVFPAASTIKIPIMAYMMWAAERGEICLESNVQLDLSLPKYHQKEGSGILTHLSSSLKLNIRDLITLMIIESDNIAANILLDLVNLPSVNHFLSQVGMKVTRVTDYIEDFEKLRDPKHNPSTPAEMGHLLKLIYQGDLPYSPLMMDILKEQHLASRIPFFIADDENLTIAHKTGTLDGIVHDVGLIIHPSFRYVLAVMTEGYSVTLFAELLIARISALIYQHFVTIT